MRTSNVDEKGLFAGDRKIRPLSLHRNFSWTLAGNLVYAGCQWGMLVVLTKATAADDVGRFALALAISAPVFMFTNLQLRSIQATDAHRDYDFEDYFRLRLCLTLLGFLFVLVITFASQRAADARMTILFVALAKAIESISDVCYGVLQFAERMDKMAISLIVKGPLSLGALVAGVRYTHNVAWGAAGLALAWVLVLAFYDLPVTRHLLLLNTKPSARAAVRRSILCGFRPSWNLTKLRRLFTLALPLGTVMALISLNTNVPRYFLAAFTGESPLAVYAAMAYLVTAGGMVINAMGQVVAPRLARYHAAHARAAFRGLLIRLLAVTVAFSAAALFLARVVGRRFLSFLYRPEYAVRPDLFAWLMAAAAFWYLASVLGFAATATRRLKAQPIALISVVLISCTSCYFFVPKWGISGAVTATVISSSFCMFSYVVVLLLPEDSR
jgi:O-antigen/teichoic acid export membrane protein